MPIKIPNGLPAAQTLAGENIFVMDETRAVTQDIRPLQILVLNLMPTKIETETQLSRLLGNTPLQVELEFLHTSSHESKNTAKEHLFKFYQVFDQVKDRNFDGMVVTGAPVEQSFKTLVMQGKSKQYYVFVLPIAEEVDLKAAARTVGEKSVEMIHVKDITAITGYVRGGCTPIGMKKQFPTVLHESAKNFDKIYVSGGRIGTTITVNPDALLGVVRGTYADIIVH